MAMLYPVVNLLLTGCKVLSVQQHDGSIGVGRGGKHLPSTRERMVHGWCGGIDPDDPSRCAEAWRMLGVQPEAEMTIPFAIELLLCLVLNELLIIGIWNATSEDDILFSPAEWIRNRTPEWVTKPLFDCPPCAASVHGSWFWVLSHGLPATLNDFLWMAVYILALSGLGKLVVANLLQQE